MHIIMLRANQFIAYIPLRGGIWKKGNKTLLKYFDPELSALILVYHPNKCLKF